MVGFMNSALNIYQLLLCLMPILLQSCVDVSTPKDEDLQNGKNKETKTVAVYDWQKVNSANYGNNNIDLLINVGDRFYGAYSNGLAQIYSWPVTALATNIKDFVTHDDFKGSHKIAKSNVAHSILALEPMDRYAVAITRNGLALFAGKNQKAAMSSEFGTSAWDSDVTNVHGLTANGEQLIYVTGKKGVNRAVQWFNIAKPASQLFGFEQSGLQVAFSDGTPVDTKGNLITAVAPMPQGDGRVLLAGKNGLYTVGNDSVGVDTSNVPKLEQANSTEYLFGSHGRIKSMHLVGSRYLVAIFNTGGVAWADLTTDEKDFKFSDIEMNGTDFQRIRSVGQEAIIIGNNNRNAVRFRDGKFDKLFDVNELANKPKLVNPDFTKPFNKDDFKGGHVGAAGINRIYDAAWNNGYWFYATDDGIYRVERKEESKDFKIKK